MILMMEQRTEEWFEARRGRITASRMGDIFGSNLKRLSYMHELAAEILTGEQARIGFNSPYTAWGKRQEPKARDWYVFSSEYEVEQVGLIINDETGAASSPDGLSGDSGVLEIKCPESPVNHIEVLNTGRIPEKYIYQTYGHIWVSGREWCDYVSYDPRMPENIQGCTIRAKRTDEIVTANTKTQTELLDSFARGYGVIPSKTDKDSKILNDAREAMGLTVIGRATIPANIAAISDALEVECEGTQLNKIRALSEAAGISQFHTMMMASFAKRIMRFKQDTYDLVERLS
ncbi:MAG: hypothetical protein HKM94_08145 [Halobacteria archaeon]|nr:hypothetical protein [Halobacteria archaeon]